MYLSIRYLRRAVLQAENCGRTPAIRVRFTGHAYFPAEDWVLIQREEFDRLTEAEENPRA